MIRTSTCFGKDRQMHSGKQLKTVLLRDQLQRLKYIGLLIRESNVSLVWVKNDYI